MALQTLLLFSKFRGESHIDFRTQSVIMTQGVGVLSLMTYWNLEKLSNFKVHELPWMSMNLQCSSIFTIFFIKTKLHLQKAVLKASLFEICYYCWLLWRSEIHRIRKMVNLDTHWIISISLYFGSKIMGSRL